MFTTTKKKLSRAILFAAVLLGACELSAATFTVTNDADSGPGSLRQALVDSAAAAGADTVDFAPALSGGTITLASQIDVYGEVTVDASALPAGLTIAGSGSHRLFYVISVHTAMLGLTLTGGRGDAGGAILCHWLSTLTLTRCTLSGNAATGSGGAISTTQYCRLRLQDCTLTANTAAGRGGAIHGSAEVFELSIARCTFSGNSAFTGGAVGVEDSMPLRIDDSTFSGNTATTGGAIFATRTSYGGVGLQRCTFTGNSASQNGGAIYNNDGGLGVSHCTIAGNTANVSGGGISVRNLFDHYSFLEQSIVAGNSAPSGADIYSDSGSVVLFGANIIQSHVSVAIGPGIIINADPMLVPLADNGGPTKTMALLPGSPARNASVDSTATSDQRGHPMVGAPDIGAFETSTGMDYFSWIANALPNATPAQRAHTFDFDGDQMSNGTEWLAQTIPSDGTDYLRIKDVFIEGGEFKVSFFTAIGRDYRVEYSTDLKDWTSHQIVAGNGGLRTVSTGPVTFLPSFFARVRIEP